MIRRLLSSPRAPSVPADRGLAGNGRARPVRTIAPARPSHACLAPSVQMYLAPDGDVRVCCRNWQALGNVMDGSLLEMWRGAAHRDVVSRLAVGDHSAGCERCHAETEVEGRATAYPSHFDSFTDAVEAFGDDAGLRWPTRIEFNLSNRCNLMCIQCDGLLSSAIRAHRDHLPALPDAYGDRFFDDIRRFIPHLTEAQFAGGEPFFARENFRIWELIEELNPELPCIVVTNATQWNKRVDDITSRVRMGFTFSIDAATKATYESIRVNSDFDVVMGNVDRYLAKSRRASMPVEVNFCLMRQNHHEFGDLLVWAESKGIKANVSVVRNPPECSLASLTAAELRPVVESLERDSERVRPQLGEWNRPIWDAELERLRSWVQAPDDARGQLWWESSPPLDPGDPPAAAVAVPVEVAVAPERWVGALDDAAEVHWIETTSGDAQGQPGRVLQFSEGLPGVLGVDRTAVDGAPAAQLLTALEVRFGRLVDISSRGLSGGGSDTELTFERGRARTSTRPEPSGGQRILFAVSDRIA